MVGVGVGVGVGCGVGAALVVAGGLVGFTVLVGGGGCAAGVLGDGWMRVAGVWVSVGVFGVGARLVGGAGCSAGVFGEGWMRVAGAWVSAGVFGVGAGLVGGAGCSAVGVGMAVGEGSVLGTSGVLWGGVSFPSNRGGFFIMVGSAGGGQAFDSWRWFRSR